MHWLCCIRFKGVVFAGSAQKEETARAEIGLLKGCTCAVEGDDGWQAIVLFEQGGRATGRMIAERIFTFDQCDLGVC